MGELHFEFQPLTSPVSKESNEVDELWGEIKLIWTNDDQEEVLLDHQWDFRVVCDWYAESRDKIKSDAYPFAISDSQSIAENRFNLYSKDDFPNDDVEDSYYESLADYFSNHIFKLKGTSTPLFFIGMNRGIGEISRYDGLTDLYLCYSFNMNSFIKSTDLLVSNVLGRT